MENINVYDSANNLAQAIKKSREYTEFKEMKEKISKDAETKKKIDEFEKIRYEEQKLAAQGEKNSEEKMKKLQELYSILIQNPDVKNYFDVEVRFYVMFSDINKIIGDSIKDILEA